MMSDTEVFNKIKNVFVCNIILCLLFCILMNKQTYANINSNGLAIIGNSHAAITCVATGIDLKVISNKESRNRMDMMEPSHSIGGGDLDENKSTNAAIYSFINDADKYTKAVIYLGTNDIKFGKDLFFVYYKNYIDRVLLKNPYIKITLMSIPKTKNEFLPIHSIEEFNGVINYIASLYENVSAYTIEDKDIEFWDNVHLTYDAYEKILDKVVREDESKVIYQQKNNDIGPGDMNLDITTQ